MKKKRITFDEKCLPSLPVSAITDARTAETQVRKNIDYVLENLIFLRGNYEPLWEAASLVVKFSFTHHQAKIWQIAMKENLFDLAALLAVGVGSLEWQDETMRLVLANDLWKKDDRAYDALLILWQHNKAANINSEFVQKVLATDRPNVLRVYA